MSKMQGNWKKIKEYFLSLQKYSEVRTMQKTFDGLSVKAEPLKKHPLVKALRYSFSELSTMVKGFFKALRRYPKAGVVGNAGVCAGIAYQLKTEVIYVRIALLLGLYINLLLFGLVYVLLWIYVPKAAKPKGYKRVCEKAMDGGFYRIHSANAGWFGGVCSGLAYRFKVKTIIVRASWVAAFILMAKLFSLDMMIIFAYMICWISWPKVKMPEDHAKVCSISRDDLSKPVELAKKKKAELATRLGSSVKKGSKKVSENWKKTSFFESWFPK